MEESKKQQATVEKATESAEQQAPGKNNKNNNFRVITLIAIILIVIVGGYGLFMNTQKTSKQKTVMEGTIKIAVLGTFSGDADTGSFPALKGADLAKKDLNASNFEILTADTQCEESLAPAAIQGLIDKQVVAIIGDACSSSSLASLPLANKNKVVMISPTASSISLSIPNDYFFRVVPPDIYQGQFLANLLYDKGFKKVAIVHTDENYGIGLTNIFKENFAKLGGKILTTQSVKRDIVNVAQQVAAIKASNPEAIVILNNSFTSGVAVIKQVRAVGMKVPFFASDGIYDSSLLTDGGPAVEGLTVTTFSGGTKQFKQSFAAEYGESTGIDESPEAYDAFKAIYLAVQKGARTGEEIAATLPSIEFQGASAYIKFDKNGDVSDNYQYLTLQVKDGKFVPLGN